MEPVNASIRARVIFVIVLIALAAVAFVAAVLLPARVTVVQLVPKPDRNGQRFADIAGNRYGRAGTSSFNYATPASGVLEYERKAPTFTGKLTARGYKPNFAYQMKLVATAADQVAFEALGYAGRWMLPGEGTNFTDDDFKNLKDRTRAESYIFFDWFVTDADGNADKEFRLDSSLHVLMSKTLENAEAPENTKVHTFNVNRFPRAFYDEDKPVKPVEIWAMSESYWTRSRPEPGGTKLPAGKYRCVFRLTEECFHSAAGGGAWATAVDVPVEFEVLGAPPAK
ncbi:MAG: hypothetical protein WC712_11905 [Candidatus Brocadiia bacterium]